MHAISLAINESATWAITNAVKLVVLLGLPTNFVATDAR